MGLSEIQSQFLQHKQMLFDLGLLDDEFFQLQKLQDEKHPHFIVEVMAVFFDDCERILNDLTVTLNGQNVDYRRVDAYVHQLKGSSASIGARRVSNACIPFRRSCNFKDAPSCLACLQEVKDEFAVTKENLQKLLMLEKQIVDAGEPIPPME